MATLFSTHSSSQNILITFTIIFLTSSLLPSSSGITETDQRRPFKKIYAFTATPSPTPATPGPSPAPTALSTFPTHLTAPPSFTTPPTATPMADSSSTSWLSHCLCRSCRRTVTEKPTELTGLTSRLLCKEAFDDALFWVGEIGVNDYAYTLGSTVSGDTIRKLAINSFTEFLQGLLKKGAKYVVVEALPTTGCLPLAMTLAPSDDRDDIGCVKSVNNQSNAHNLVLQSKVSDLRQQFPQAIIVYADYWNAYRTVMQSPEKYGFKESFKACCGTGEPYNFEVFNTCGNPSVTACSNPAQYINWDGVHLTEAMYKVVADMFIDGNLCNPPFKTLLERKLRQP
ncbi:hypothetical protein ES288_A12G215400v1 [Gossypium darwinii]|uniref:SGNH hydrolase-type esterase domain-containing protein n=1 Tax=Gossypium darwinii TaxID=34276 RepID=A0A5D2EC57_GOSDA|nr:hypothetical protein ES288_A12G215400v1 [Gossypium darwinii]